MAGKGVVSCIGPSYHLADVRAAVQSSINCYPQPVDQGLWHMRSVPGEVEIADMGGEIRGQRDVEGRLFVAVASTLYEVQTDGTYTSRGALLTSTGYVGMAHNATQLAIVDGANLYVLTLATNVLTTVVSAGWRGSHDVHELDGYMVFVAPDTQQFYISAIDDGTDLDALDFSSADSQPDDIITHRVSHRQLFLFGTHSTEIWINSGAADFPFTRYNSYTMDVGVVGRRAAVAAADTLLFVGRTRGGRGIVYIVRGNQPQRVSTLAVEEALAESTDISAATMWAYQVAGHEFVGIDAPGLSTTWVYDAAVDQWHERGEWDDGWQPLRAKLHMTFDGEVYAGDEYGSLVRLDDDTHTRNGRTMVRERTWPHLVASSLEPITYRGLELAVRTGGSTLGSITLELSNDGGNTFGPPLHRSLGTVGQWLRRVRWFPLGTSRNRVFRLRCSDAVPFSLYSAAVDAS